VVDYASMSDPTHRDHAPLPPDHPHVTGKPSYKTVGLVLGAIVAGWFVLVLLFLAIWQFLSPERPMKPLPPPPTFHAPVMSER
jgi:hypothetical protein